MKTRAKILFASILYETEKEDSGKVDSGQYRLQAMINALHF